MSDFQQGAVASQYTPALRAGGVIKRDGRGRGPAPHRIVVEMVYGRVL